MEKTYKEERIRGVKKDKNRGKRRCTWEMKECYKSDGISQS